MVMHSDSEAPLWHMNVHVAKAKVQVNKVNRSRTRLILRNSVVTCMLLPLFPTKKNICYLKFTTQAFV